MNKIITERVNLFEPNVYISMCIKLVGKINTKELTIAIKEAFKANEATMSKIVLNNSEAFYEKMPLSGCKVEIASSSKSIIELIRINEKIPLEIDKGELIRTFIVSYEDKTELLIMANHLVGDGKSIIYFLRIL